MEQSISRGATILNVEQFPVYQLPSGNVDRVHHLSGYLKKLMANPLQKQASYLEFPSLSTLADFFKCSYLEMYDVFRALRSQGYDYQFSSVDGAVRVWKKPKAMLKTVKETL